MLWVLSNMASWCLGMTAGFTVWYWFRGDISINTSNGFTGVDFGIGDLLGGFILGIIVAFGQYLIIRSGFPSARKWMISSAAGLFVGSLFARFLGQPILQYSNCGFFCFGFDLPPRWLPTSFGLMTFTTGGPLAGIILGVGIAISHLIAFPHQRSAKFLWLAANGLSLGLSFTIGIFISNEILIVGAVTGLIYGLITIIPLKRLFQVSARDTASNV